MAKKSPRKENDITAAASGPRSPCSSGENTKGNNRFPKIPPPPPVAHDPALMPSLQQRISLADFSKLLEPRTHTGTGTAVASLPRLQPPPPPARPPPPVDPSHLLDSPLYADRHAELHHYTTFLRSNSTLPNDREQTLISGTKHSYSTTPIRISLASAPPGRPPPGTLAALPLRIRAQVNRHPTRQQLSPSDLKALYLPGTRVIRSPRGRHTGNRAELSKVLLLLLLLI